MPAKAVDPLYNADFTGGLNTYNSPILIQPNQSPDLQNVLADKSGSLDRRQGYVLSNTTVLGDGAHDVNGLFYFQTSGGTNYCLAFVGSTGTFSTDGCQTFTTFVSTLTAGNDVNCDAFNDKAFCVNNQYNFYFTGAANTVPLTSAQANLQYIRVFNNQCFASGATGNLSRLYYSNINDCTTWNTATQFIDIAPNNGDQITAIGYPLYGGLPIYKKYSTWYLTQVGSGNNGPVFQVVNISPNTGAKNQRSVQNFFQEQLFDSVGPYGGQPGIYAFDGVKVYEKSKNVRGSLDSSDTFTASKNQISFNNKSAYDLGNLCVAGQNSCLSDTQIFNFLMPSTFSVTENTGSQFSSSGTIVNLSTAPISGSLVLYNPNNTTFTNAGAEIDGATDWSFVVNNNTGWTRESDGVINSQCPSSPNPHVKFGNFAWKDTGSPVNIPYNITIAILDTLGNTLTTTTQLINNNMNWTENKISLPNNKSQFQVKITGSNQANVMLSSSIVNGTYLDLWFMGCDNGVGTVFPVMDIDETTGITSGTYTSQIYDTSFSTPLPSQFNATVSSNSNSGVTFQVRVSTSPNNDLWDSYVAATPGQIVQVNKKRYYQYQANFTLNASTNVPANFTNGQLNSVTTGTWQSAETFTSNSMNSNGWGTFQTVQNTSGLGSINYAVRVSTYVGGTAFAPTVIVTPNNSITASTGAYVVVIATFSVSTATDTAKVGDITLNWSQGNQATTPASMVFQNRYHYAVQSQNGSYNNTMYVLDTNGSWWKWNDMNARSLVVSNQRAMMGGGANTSGFGNIFNIYNGDNDNGGAISSYYNTKDFDLGNILHYKSVNRVISVYNSNPTNLTVDLLRDNNQQDYTYSVSMSTGAPYGVNFKPVNPALNGNTFRLKFSNNAANAPFRVLGYGMEYSDMGIMPSQ